MMTEAENEFDLIFKKYGGIEKYDEQATSSIASFLEAIRGHLEFIKSTSRYNFPTPYTNIINNGELNAAASISNGDYFIGINSGTIIILREVFNRMLSSPFVFKNWGDATQEVETKKIFNSQITNSFIYFNAKDPFEDILPKDPTRKNLANELFNIAMRFLLAHEYGHIISGHLGYFNSMQNNFIYLENNENSGLNFFTSQTLEFDADCFSITNALRNMEYYIENRELISPNTQPFYVEFKQSLILLTYGVYSFFLLFGEQNVKSITEMSHPTIKIRQFNFLALIATYTQKFGDKMNREICKLVVDAAVEVELAFREVSIKEIDKDFSGRLSKEENSHYIDIRNNWKNVRPLLVPFAHGNLAPVQ